MASFGVSAHRHAYQIETEMEYKSRQKIVTGNFLVLPEGITLAQLKTFHSSRPRNPVLAEACFKGSYIDSWGSGIQKITDVCKAAGLSLPVMEEQFGGFIVKLFKDRFSEEELKKLREDLAYQQKFVASIQQKLSNEKFVQNAPESVIALERKKQADGEARVKAIEEQLLMINC